MFLIIIDCLCLYFLVYETTKSADKLQAVAGGFMHRSKFVPPTGERTYEINEEPLGLPKTVLLVEDDVEYALLVKTFLESYNYSVTVAADGVQGLKRIMDRDFDVIICDLLMPNLPGDMFYLGVERVKPQLARRFIFITGHQNNPKISDFTKRVKALTLFKPFEMHLLLETILVSLKNSQRPG
jgi:CheY-like chemotaxis protein